MRNEEPEYSYQSDEENGEDDVGCLIFVICVCLGMIAWGIWRVANCFVS